MMHWQMNVATQINQQLATDCGTSCIQRAHKQQASPTIMHSCSLPPNEPIICCVRLAFLQYFGMPNAACAYLVINSVLVDSLLLTDEAEFFWACYVATRPPPYDCVDTT